MFLTVRNALGLLPLDQGWIELSRLRFCLISDSIIV